MSNDIQPFDPNVLKTTITNRIKEQFVALIPDDQWEQMVEVELNRFTTTTSNDYSRSPKRSELSLMIEEALRGLAREAINKELEETYRSKVVENGTVRATEAMKKLVTEHATEIFAAVYSDMAQGVVNNVLNNIRNRGY